MHTAGCFEIFNHRLYCSFTITRITFETKNKEKQDYCHGSDSGGLRVLDADLLLRQSAEVQVRDFNLL